MYHILGSKSFQRLGKSETFFFFLKHLKVPYYEVVMRQQETKGGLKIYK